MADARNPTVALITGAGSGLGRELARQLADTGTAIAAIDIGMDGLNSLGEELRKGGKRFSSAVVDVTDAAGLAKAVAGFEQDLGPVDLLIASAGVGLETSALDLHADTMGTVLNVNLLGVANSLAAVLPGMLQRRRGHLVAISSLASFRGLPRMLGYCASKAGVNSLMEGLRVEVKPFGLHVTTICPGWIKTPMTAHLRGHMPAMMELDYAVRQILWAIRRKKSVYAFPRSLAWQVRLLRYLPASASDWLVGQMLRKIKVAKPI